MRSFVMRNKTIILSVLFVIICLLVASILVINSPGTSTKTTDSSTDDTNTETVNVADAPTTNSQESDNFTGGSGDPGVDILTLTGWDTVAMNGELLANSLPTTAQNAVVDRILKNYLEKNSATQGPLVISGYIQHVVIGESSVTFSVTVSDLTYSISYSKADDVLTVISPDGRSI